MTDKLSHIDKRLYSIQETVRMTGLGRSTIYTLLGEGRIRSVKVGKRRLIPSDCIEEFISSLAGTA